MAMGLDPLDDDGALDPAAELDAWRARLQRADASASWNHPRHGAPYRAKLQLVYEVDPLDNDNMLDPRGNFERDLAERAPSWEMASDQERTTEDARRGSIGEHCVGWMHFAEWIPPHRPEPDERPISAATVELDRERKRSYEAGLAAGAVRGLESALALVRGAQLHRYDNGRALAEEIETTLNATSL